MQKELLQKYPARNQLKVGKRKHSDKINSGNILMKKRKKVVKQNTPVSVPTKVHATKKLLARDLKRGMRVSIKTTDFDGNVPGSWSKGRPMLTFGKLLGWKKGGSATVLWEGDKKVDIRFNPLLVQLSHAPGNDHSKSTIMAIMLALEVGFTPSFRPSDQEGAWPKNFFEAIIRSDWRRWV